MLFRSLLRSYLPGSLLLPSSGRRRRKKFLRFRQVVSSPFPWALTAPQPTVTGVLRCLMRACDGYSMVMAVRPFWPSRIVSSAGDMRLVAMGRFHSFGAKKVFRKIKYGQAKRLRGSLYSVDVGRYTSGSGWATKPAHPAADKPLYGPAPGLTLTGLSLRRHPGRVCQPHRPLRALGPKDLGPPELVENLGHGSLCCERQAAKLKPSISVC